MWLLLHAAGVIVGQAISIVGLVSEGAADRVMMLANSAVEKAINLVLSLVGLGLMGLGFVSLISGRGPLTLLLGVH